MKKIKRVLSLTLCAAMLLGNFPAVSFAAEEYGLCEHHTSHVDCGYVAAVEAVDCDHEHDELCGYAPGEEEIPCDCGQQEHAEDCAYTPAIPETSCTHDHEDCSYVEAVEEQPCAFECEDCSAEVVVVETSAPTEATGTETETTEPEAESTQPAEEILVPEQSAVSVEAVMAAKTELEATIEQQVRAFAQSINKADADDSAATAIAKHGLTGGGKKLSVGKSHALTATLWNSEMMQAAMTVSCSGAIAYMQKLDMDSLPYVRGFCIWNGADSHFNTYVCTGASYEYKYRVLANAESSEYTGTRNAYDSSLDWISGTTALDISFQTKSVTTDTATYSVTCTVRDRFDFDTSQGSGFDKLISGLAALLFQEFDWESTVTFTLTVPYSCSHSTQMYHFTYDTAERVLISDNSDGSTSNAVTKLTYQNYSGNVAPCYHELDMPIRLYHNKPWVMEYTIRKPGNFVIAPLSKVTLQQPALMNYSNSGLMFQYKNIVDSQITYNCYGIRYDGLLSNSITYTFLLENVIDATGNNMVYLTIFNADNQTTVLSKSPMDDYYENVNGVLTLKDSASNYLNGVDLFINYIGNKDYSFHADYFDLKVWENGVDGGSSDYFTSKVTKPTCAARGYTTHTCACCGYNYKDTYTAKTEHKFDTWTQTTAPTCTSNGEETRTCSGCGTTETRTVESLGHTYTITVTAPNCTEQGFTTHTCTECGDNYMDTYVEVLGHDFASGTCNYCGENDPNYTPGRLLGDVTGDEKVTATDYSRLLAHVKKVNLITDEAALAAADVTGDGKITATDYSRLLAHVKKVNPLW